MELAVLIVSIVGVVTAAGSAVCWFMSARIPTSYPLAYLGGPPANVKRNMDCQTRLNAWAAGLAGVAVLCQGLLLAGSLFSN